MLFVKLPGGKPTGPGGVHFFYISPLKCLNLVLMPVQNGMATGTLGQGVSRVVVESN